MIRRPWGLVPLLFLLAPLLPATPGHAAPVFDAASVDPAVISPNGDFVQDFATIEYRVAVDTAQVVVALTTPGGGSTLVTLQPLTSRGAGIHTLVFDGRDGGGNRVPDGDYEIRIFGVGSQGEGQETRTLPLGIDTVAPEFLSVDLVQPAVGYIQNGNRVVIDACVTDDPDVFIVDFSALDTDYNPGGVTVTPLDPTCNRISYTVSLTNDRIDGSNIPVQLQARDLGGNRATTTLGVCLLNQPPVVVSSELDSDFPVFQNGDIIVARATFSSPALVLQVSADFSALDSGFDPSNVFIRNLGGQSYEFTYRITDLNFRADGDYPIVLRARDPGCGEAVDSSLQVTLDNQGEFAALVENVVAVPAAFSPNGDGVQETVAIRFNVLEDTVRVTLKVRWTFNGSPQEVQVEPERLYFRGPAEYVWDGTTNQNVSVDDVVDQDLEFIVNALSTDVNQRRNVPVTIRLDRKKPSLLSVEATDGPLANFDVLDLVLRYDERVGVQADFTGLDDAYDPGNLTGPSEGTGFAYSLSYTISQANTRPDSSGIVVPVLATDLAGNSTLSQQVRVCLSNHPPRLLSARLLSGTPPFRNGSRFTVQTVWESARSPLTVAYDFSLLDSGFDPGEGDAREAGADTFVVTYTISSNNSQSNGLIPLEVSALDRGCGVTTTEALRVELLNQDLDRPTIDPVAAVTRNPKLRLTGIAPLAVKVEIRVGPDPVDTLTVSGDRFDGEVDLVPGSNRFAAVGIDEAGNRSSPSQPVETLFVESSFAEVPKRFIPGNAFTVGLLEPAQDVRVRIFNLEGVRIRELPGGAGGLISIPWDGTDDNGTVVSSGPYVAVVLITPTGGGSVESIREAFVFTRR